jgi:hypothetical protein
MKATITTVGLLGGVAASLLLLPAAYLDVPRGYITDWSTAPINTGVITTLIALLVMVLTGMAGANRRPELPATSGIVAGLMASAVALVSVGLPSASVMAMGELVAELETGRVSSLQLRKALAAGIILLPFYQAIVTALFLGTGLLLGWLGGVVQDLWKGTPVRYTPSVRPTPVPWVGLAVGLLATPTLLAGIAAYDGRITTELGGTSTWLGQAQLTSPLLVSGAIIGACLFVIARDAAIVRREGQRMRGLVWLVAAIGMVGVQALVAVPAFWRIILLPGGWVAGALVVGSLLAGLLAGRWSNLDLETTPRTFGEVVAEGQLAATLAVVLLAVSGTSAAIAAALLANPWFTALAGAEGGVVYVESAAQAIHTLFVSHSAYPVLMLVGMIAWSFLAVPIWGAAQRLRKR